jgi:predicted lysophospholipase L1 biosynthesis ABC-type transport system permease subunit
MALLNLKTGDTIDVGDATLRIAGEVIQEPDAGFNPFQMAPRLMMNTADVAKTGAVQPGSRVSWRYKLPEPRSSWRTMKSGCCRSWGRNIAGSAWSRTTARWANRWSARSSSCCCRRC